MMRRKFTPLGKAFLIFMTLMMVVWSLFPIYWMLSTSLKSDLDVIKKPPDIWPATITLEHYKEILNIVDTGNTPIIQFFANSVITSVATVLLAILFSIPAFTAVYLTRRFILPAIPENLLFINSYVVTKGMAIMFLFALMMLFAAKTMLLNKKKSDTSAEQIELNYILIFSQAVVIGLLTGLVGAGGGFIIIPALIAFAKLSMKEAVGTSLLIIAINSLIGFTGDIGHLEVDWLFLLGFTALSVIGIFIGTYLSNFIDGKKLKKGFGWFVLLMAVYIIYKELSI